MKNISVLGCGWLGLSLAEHLLRDGYKVKGSARSLERANLLDSVDVISFIIDLDADKRALEEFLITDILIVAVPLKDVSSFQLLIPLIEQSTVKKVIFTSSISVYKSNNGVVTEASETLNTELNQIEKLFLKNQHFETSVLRLGGLIGYERDPGSFFKEGKKLNNPEGYVNLIHRDDCIHIIGEIIKMNIWGGVFNLCSNEHPKRSVYYTSQLKRMNGEVLEIDDSESTFFKIVSSEKLNLVLGYQYKYVALNKLY